MPKRAVVHQQSPPYMGVTPDCTRLYVFANVTIVLFQGGLLGAGSESKDIVYIDEATGVKIALADHRSSNMSEADLIRLASEVRIAGLLSGKSGIVYIHTGRGRNKLRMSIWNEQHEMIGMGSLLRRVPLKNKAGLSFTFVDGICCYAAGDTASE